MTLALPTDRRPGPLRLALINPPFRYFPGMKKGGSAYARPPLGIAYLAGYARKYFPEPLDIRLFDFITRPGSSYEEMVRVILDHEPDLVGFTAVTGTIRDVERMCSAIHAARPGVVTIAGGPHITALPTEPHPGIDANLEGECEQTFVDLLQALASGGVASAIPGVHVREGDGWLSGPKPALLKDLDVVPFPARDLLRDLTYFHSYPHQNPGAFTTFFTSRGCPFDCNFCGNEIVWDTRVRYHSLPRVYAEIDHVVEDHGVGLLFFDDDTFTAKKARAREICGYVRDRHPQLRWVCHTRADTLSRDLVFEMQASGCVEMQIGVESGDPAIMKLTEKRLSIQSVRDAFGWFKEAGIKGWATFIVGNIGETRSTVRTTIDFAKAIDPAYASFIILLPFPGTRAYTVLKSQGALLTEDWAHYSWHGRPVFETPALSRRDLIRLRRLAYLSFYLRPRKLLQVLLDTLKARSLRETFRNLQAWKSLVAMPAA